MELRELRAAGCLALLSLVVMAACGERGGSGTASEPWPPTLSAPAVLGYVALRADPADVARLLEEATGWRPQGLAAGRPFVIALLDAQVLGGDTALLFPVDDVRAFGASFAAAPTIVDLGGDRYRLELSAGSELVKLARMAGRMTSAGSPLDILDALGGSQDVAIPLVLQFEGDHALVVPSPEAAGVARRLLEGLPGAHVDSDASVVISLDVDRCETVFQEQIAGVDKKLRTLLQVGVKGAGLAQLAAGFANRGRSSDAPRLPISGEAAWTVFGMLELGQIDAVQLRLDGFGDELVGRGLTRLVGMLQADLPADAADLPGVSLADGREALRVLHTPGAPLRRLLDTLTGVPAEDDVISLGFDADRLPAALAEWLRPLAELAKGEGPPCERYLDELVALLSPLAGRIVVHLTDPPGIVCSLRPGQTLDLDGLSRWAGTLGSAMGWRGLPGVEQETGEPIDPFAGWQLFEDAGMVLALPAGVEPGPASDRLAATLRGSAAVGAPVLRGRYEGAVLDISTHGGELLIETRFGDGSDESR